MEGDINQKPLTEAEKTEVGEAKLKENIWREIKKIWVVAGPAIFTRVSTFSVTVISHVFVGHIGATELAAYSLCSTVLLRFGNGVLVLMIVRFSICGLRLHLMDNVTDRLRFMSLEFWYNTILVLLTGNMKNAEVVIDALSICLNISGWEMMISLGFLAAASVRVSNELGRGSSKAAKFSIILVTLTSLSIGLVLFVLLLCLRESLAYVFTESEEVAKAVADLSPLLACSILLNSVQPVLSGVAVGAGLQSIVAWVNIASYYLVGIPIGVVLGYVFNMEVKGVWIGMLLGTLVQTIVLVIITWKTDWDKQVVLARTRVNKWFVPESKEENGNTENAA